MILQHTAGCHGGQWRHLMECESITSQYQLFAYDLPFHGKSVPPVGSPWWEEEYNLKGDFLRDFVVAFKNALALESPVFMGCSVGGMLALDLARHCAEHFSAVISLEGALYVGDAGDSLQYLYHLKVSNEFKARLMNGIMAPTSPAAYRNETMQVYAAGWPAVFLVTCITTCTTMTSEKRRPISIPQRLRFIFLTVNTTQAEQSRWGRRHMGRYPGHTGITCQIWATSQ